MSKKIILLIDDDAIFLMLTRRLLQKQLFLERIDTCSTLEESLAYFKQLEESNGKFPDAVFIDLDMPKTNGLEVASKLKKTYQTGRPEMKFFILSSSISQRDRQAVTGADFISYFMEKPLSPQMLSQALGIDGLQPTDIPSISIKDKQKQEENGKISSEIQKEK